MPDADAHWSTFAGELAADLALLTTTAREAGEIAMRWFRRDPRVWHKDGGSPVSEADLAVDRHLKERLLAARPEYGWLSEETADGPDRLDRTRVFVVDPIDGTRAFVAGDEGWTVSLAIVEAGRPIVAVLVQPPTGSLWQAASGGGARRDGELLTIADRSDPVGARVAGPKKFLERPAMRRLGFSAGRFVPSLALRIAQVADGRLDIAYGSGNAHDWDLAAADLLVQEAGGRLAVPSGEALAYNRADPRHPALVAAVPGLFDVARSLLADVV
ncbi:MAG: 3'(2'),5'-bisphosphate nucleotidase CysQ [Siculibacillus sp.]|nr:3'(2'),5'-bisphosphate nucleotidase CysQ [Siculibacillus sp.]